MWGQGPGLFPSLFPKLSLSPCFSSSLCVSVTPLACLYGSPRPSLPFVCLSLSPRPSLVSHLCGGLNHLFLTSVTRLSPLPGRWVSLPCPSPSGWGLWVHALSLSLPPLSLCPSLPLFLRVSLSYLPRSLSDCLSTRTSSFLSDPNRFLSPSLPHPSFPIVDPSCRPLCGSPTVLPCLSVSVRRSICLGLSVPR